MSLKSSVVYKFTCAGCESQYVGETSRHLATRITAVFEIMRTQTLKKSVGVWLFASVNQTHETHRMETEKQSAYRRPIGGKI